MGDGRTDDTAAIRRAFAGSNNYCVDGERLSYLVVGTLRISQSLCLRHADFIQAAVPADTAAYIQRRCPQIRNPSVVMDCKDPAVPAGKLDQLWRSLSVRTLFIRPDGQRPIQVNIEEVGVNRGSHPEGGSRTDSAGIWLDGADRVDLHKVEITGNGKGYGLLITNSRNINLTDLWIHDLVWEPYRGDRALMEVEVASRGWNEVPIHEFREQARGPAGAKFYGVRVQEQLTCGFLSSVSHVRIRGLRIERCLARFDTGDLPWQADGLNIGQSSSDVNIDRATIDSAWEGVDVVAGGTGIHRLRISRLAVTNAFSFGLKLGYSLRNAVISDLKINGAGLSGVVIYGPAQDVSIVGASISDVGTLTGPDGPYSPWPRGKRAGIRLDGAPPSEPDRIVLEHVNVSGQPNHFEFGILNTGGRAIRITNFKARGFATAAAHGIPNWH